jgi:hypothetical protein
MSRKLKSLLVHVLFGAVDGEFHFQIGGELTPAELQEFYDALGEHLDGHTLAERGLSEPPRKTVREATEDQRKLNRARSAILLNAAEVQSEPKRYLIKLSCPGKNMNPDYHRTTNESWTTKAMSSLKKWPLLVLDSRDEAQEEIERLSLDLDMMVWTLSYEEYTECS